MTSRNQSRTSLFFAIEYLMKGKSTVSWNEMFPQVALANSSYLIVTIVGMVSLWLHI